jgi:hypothetical protein
MGPATHIGHAVKLGGSLSSDDELVSIGYTHVAIIHANARGVLSPFDVEPITNVGDLPHPLELVLEAP